MSLAQLPEDGACDDPGCIATALNRFTEGHSTSDLVVARAILRMSGGYR
jgi:hypothetical protein